MTTLPPKTLPEQCEAASKADRNIDAEIACLIGKPLGNIDHWLHAADISYRPTADGYYVAVLPDDRTSEAFQARCYTASVDAAMSLIPMPGKWSITAGHSGDWQACVWLKDGLALDWRAAATPALALCAAALRARESHPREPLTEEGN